MRLTRRQFNRVIAVSAATSVVSPSLASSTRPATRPFRRQDEGLFDWFSPLDGVHVIQKHGGNSLLLAPDGPGEALLVDCKNPGMGEALRRAIQRDGVELTTVVNTHHHADHTGGNNAFTRDLEVIAQDACADRCALQFESYLKRARQAMIGLGDDQPRLKQDLQRLVGDEAHPDARDFVPGTRVSDRHTLKIAGGTVELRHIGAGHTDNDLFVWSRTHNVLHTGDLVFNGLNPYIDVGAGATTRGWQRSLLAMIELCDDDTVVVPGHGAVGDVQILRNQHAYFDGLRAELSAARSKGIGRERMLKMMPEACRGLGFEQMRARNIAAVLDELDQEG